MNVGRDTVEQDSQTPRGSGVVSRGAVMAISLLLRIYRAAVSPWLGPACRFTPTCSEYALEAVNRHGPLGGGRLAVGRILRCHPLGGLGYDPVPPRLDAD